MKYGMILVCVLLFVVGLGVTPVEGGIGGGNCWKVTISYQWFHTSGGVEWTSCSVTGEPGSFPDPCTPSMPSPVGGGGFWIYQQMSVSTQRVICAAGGIQ